MTPSIATTVLQRRRVQLKDERCNIQHANEVLEDVTYTSGKFKSNRKLSKRELNTLVNQICLVIKTTIVCNLFPCFQKFRWQTVLILKEKIPDAFPSGVFNKVAILGNAI